MTVSYEYVYNGTLEVTKKNVLTRMKKFQM